MNKDQIKVINEFINDLDSFKTYNYPPETFIGYLKQKWKFELDSIKQYGEYLTPIQKRNYIPPKTTNDIVLKLKKCKTCDGCYLSNSKLYGDGNSEMLFDNGKCEYGFKMERSNSNCGFKPLEPCYKPKTELENRKVLKINLL